MKLNFKMYSKFLKAIIIFVLFLGIKNIAFMQTGSDQIIISWETENFVPYEFGGKKLVTPGSDILIGFDFIKNNQVINLSKNKIYWYINNELISNAPGIKQIKITAPNQRGGNVDVRVELPEYGVLKTIEIPIVNPKIVIDAPFPKKEVYENNFEVNILLYFFNLPKDSLKEDPAQFFNISWQINGNRAKPASEDPLKLKIFVDSNEKTSINIKAFVQNALNQLESADKEVNLIFIK
jgi:hypothetical protein